MSIHARCSVPSAVPSTLSVLPSLRSSGSSSRAKPARSALTRCAMLFNSAPLKCSAASRKPFSPSRAVCTTFFSTLVGLSLFMSPPFCLVGCPLVDMGSCCIANRARKSPISGEIGLSISSRDLLLLFNVDGSGCALPFELQRGGICTTFVERDGELLNRSRGLTDLHVDTGEILLLVVLRAPLAGLLVDDQLPRRFSGKRVEGVLASGNRGATDDEIGISGERRRAIRTGTPHFAERDEFTHNLAAARRGAAVVDRYFFPISEGMRRRA